MQPVLAACEHPASVAMSLHGPPLLQPLLTSPVQTLGVADSPGRLAAFSGAPVRRPVSVNTPVWCPVAAATPVRCTAAAGDPVRLPGVSVGLLARSNGVGQQITCMGSEPAPASLCVQPAAAPGPSDSPSPVLCAVAAWLGPLQLPIAQSIVELDDALCTPKDVGNFLSHYHTQASPVLVDCRRSSPDLTYAALLAVQTAKQTKDSSILYWITECSTDTRPGPLLQNMMVVHRTNCMDASDWVLLADTPCHQKMRLCSLVCCSSACLQVPISWQLEPPCEKVPSGQISGPVRPSRLQVTLQSLESASLLFVHAAELNGVPARVLFDTGATHSFIDSSFAAQHGFALSSPVDMGVILGDGRSVSATGCTAALQLKFPGVLTGAVLIGIPLSTSFDVVLGQDWLSGHNAVLCAKTGRISIGGEGVTAVPAIQIAGSHSVVVHPDPFVQSSGSVHSTPAVQLAPLQGTVAGTPTDPGSAAVGPVAMELSASEMLLTAAQLKPMVRCKQVAFLCMIRCSDEVAPVQLSTLEHMELDMEQVDVGDGPVATADLHALLQQYADRFQAVPPGAVSTAGLVHTIPLLPGAEPINQRPYRTPQALLPELEKQIADLLAKGWIRPSSSPWGSPVLFVPKKDGTWRMCIDYRALNKLTVKNSWPLPRIDELLDKLVAARVFTSLDLAQGYHQFAVDPTDVPKTAFKTPMGLFEYTVLPFGLTNAPATFSRKMQELFMKYMVGHSAFVLIYLDDILIYSADAQEHLKHVSLVLQVLREANLFVKLKKCSFNKTSVEYLGHVVGQGSVSADPKKVSAIVEYALPATVTELRSFLGLANYFRKFVQGYASIAAPLHGLTAGNLPKQAQLTWTKTARRAFDKLKDALCRAPVLQIFDPEKETEIVTDASGFALGAVLLQDGLPVAYESRKMNKHELNYSVSDKELLAVKHALVTWRHYLLHKQFTVITDHRPNVTLQTCKSLGDTSGRRARWAELMQQYHIDWQYKPGATNIADALSRAPNLSVAINVLQMQQYVAQFQHMKLVCRQTAALSPVRALQSVVACHLGTMVTRRRARDLLSEHVHPVPGDTVVTHADPNTAVCGSPSRDKKPLGNVQLQVSEPTDEGDAASGPDSQCLANSDPSAVSHVQPNGEPHAGGMDHEFLRRVHVAVQEHPQFVLNLEQHAGAVLKDGLLWNAQGLLLIPPGPLRQQLITEAHVPVYSGHGGVAKTMHQLRLAGVHWPGLKSDVKSFVAACDSCQRNKTSTQAPAGTLQPLAIPVERWDTISMDLITDLPVTLGRNDSVIVFVDKLSKMVELVPCKKTIDAAGFAEVFVRSIVMRYGVPVVIISDRDPRFTAVFMRTVMELLGTKQALSTAFHPQSDGQTEVMNRVLEQYLRHYVTTYCKDWDAYLPFAAFAINNSRSSATGMTPYFLNYGRHPRTPLTSWQTFVSRVPAATEFRQRIADALTQANACLLRAQVAMKVAADKRRRPAPTYRIGDQVLLSTRHLHFKGFHGTNARKLLPRYVGPFGVVALVGKSAVKLALLKDMGIHPVFHVSLVKPYHHGDTGVAPPPVMALDNTVQYEIEKIVAQRGRGRSLQYLIKWKGYDDVHNSWEPAIGLKNAPEVVAAWRVDHPQ